MNRSLGVGLIAGLLVGGLVGWSVRDQKVEQEARSLSVAHDLEKAGFAAMTLTQIPSNIEKAKNLQLLQLRSALNNLDEMTSKPVHMEIDTPSLRDGLLRARAYASANGMPDLVEQANKVLARLYPA